MRPSRKRERDMTRLSYRIARYMEDYDPYGFRDGLEVGETVDDGIERAAGYAYDYMRTGQYSRLISEIYDPFLESPPSLKAEMDSIIAELRDMESPSQKLISKNLLKLKWRRRRCN